MFLESAAPDDSVFPFVTRVRCPMRPSQFNKENKCTWSNFKASENDPNIPLAEVITSSYLWLVFVSVVHSSATCDQMAEMAAHISHNVGMAEAHYEVHVAVELTSRPVTCSAHLMAVVSVMGRRQSMTTASQLCMCVRVRVWEEFIVPGRWAEDEWRWWSDDVLWNFSLFFLRIFLVSLFCWVK